MSTLEEDALRGLCTAGLLPLGTHAATICSQCIYTCWHTLAAPTPSVVVSGCGNAQQMEEPQIKT